MFSLPRPPALTRISRKGMLQVKTCSVNILFLGLLFIALRSTIPRIPRYLARHSWETRDYGLGNSGPSYSSRLRTRSFL